MLRHWGSPIPRTPPSPIPVCFTHQTMDSDSYFWLQKTEIRDSEILDVRRSARSWGPGCLLAHEDSEAQGQGLGYRHPAWISHMGPADLAVPAACHTWVSVRWPGPRFPEGGSFTSLICIPRSQHRLTTEEGLSGHSLDFSQCKPLPATARAYPHRPSHGLSAYA